MSQIACKRMKCFQNEHTGHCKLLDDDYGDANNEECPFYQTQDEVERGRTNAHNRLIDKGYRYLVERYEYNPQRK